MTQTKRGKLNQYFDVHKTDLEIMNTVTIKKMESPQVGDTIKSDFGIGQTDWIRGQDKVWFSLLEVI
jgi:hypothetical protein